MEFPSCKELERQDNLSDMGGPLIEDPTPVLGVCEKCGCENTMLVWQMCAQCFDAPSIRECSPEVRDLILRLRHATQDMIDQLAWRAPATPQEDGA